MVFNGKRILCVDHHKDTLDMLVQFLGDIGEVKAVGTATEALDISREQIDLYILENQFPDGTGTDLCRQIRTANPDVPIVFYSADAYEKDRLAGIAAGAQHYLVKPDDIESLKKAALQLLYGSLDGEDEANIAKADDADASSNFFVTAANTVSDLIN